HPHDLPLTLFFFQSYGPHRDLHSFPTRRSSDLYRDIPGTLALSVIGAKNGAHRNPDVIASYDFQEDAAVRGARGIEYAGGLLGTSYRGMHGSFSPRDVHNTFLAAGPDFREGFKDPLPTGNVDLAPTVAAILGVDLPGAD